jgi:26S proteasome regulatory subunit N5
MRWPGIQEIYGSHLRTTDVFTDEKRWNDLHSRVIEHVCPVFFHFTSLIEQTF